MSDFNPLKPKTKEHGEQPLKDVLKRCGLTAHQLVEASKEQLTHKVVSKACKGRPLTIKAQWKILRALNLAQKEQLFSLHDLFNY